MVKKQTHSKDSELTSQQGEPCSPQSSNQQRASARSRGKLTVSPVPSWNRGSKEANGAPLLFSVLCATCKETHCG